MGSITGSLIAREGFKVLLIEKQVHPRWKPCGEGISPEGIQLLKQFDLYKPIQNILWDIKGVSINILDEIIDIKEYEEPVAYTLNRADFDHALFKYAQDMDAETHENEKVTDVKILDGSKISVKTTKGEYKSKIVIGADGINSLPGKKLFRHWNINEITPCQVALYKVSKKNNVFHPSTMEYHFINGGYGWIFPRVQNNHLVLNIGIGKIDVIKSSLDKLFNNFIESLENNKKVKLRGKEIGGKTWTHLLPAKGPNRGTYSNCCLLVGDAGGFVNPLTGAGLRYGAISAIHAAETTTLFLNNKTDNLSIYEDKWMKDIGNIFNKAIKSREILYLLNPNQLVKKIRENPDIKKDLFAPFLVGSVQKKN